MFRFGDQILQINGDNVAGYSSDKVHDILRKSNVNNIVMVIRDRPFERTLTLHKVNISNLFVEQRLIFYHHRTLQVTLDSNLKKEGSLLLLWTPQQLEMDC